MIHVMTDIETLAQSNKPVLLEIGAAKFDMTGVLDTFHIAIDPADCQRYGLEIDASTIMWWFDPKRDEARKRQVELGRIDLFAALDGFAMWVNQTPKESLGSNWGKGATFDNVKLKAAYDAAGIEYPFGFRQDECYRTMANRFPDVEFTPIGTKHSGVDDAVSQATHLVMIAKTHGIEL